MYMGMHAQGPEMCMLTGPRVVLMCTNVGGLSFYKEEYNELPGSSKIGKNFACISESLSVDSLFGSTIFCHLGL